MAKTRGPLLSFSAGGQIAKTQVYSRWKGRPYVRQYVIPANPQTDDQSLTRNVFSFLQGAYKTAPALVTDAWDAGAAGRVLTGRNLFVKENLPLLRGTLDVPVAVITDLVLSPGARAGFAALSADATPGNDQISITVVPPPLPAGWSVVMAVAAVIRQQDAHDGTMYAINAGSEVDPTDPIVITGLASAQTYVTGGWIVYRRPDGKLAYGKSVNDLALTT